jgi:hypothetical protein
MIQNIKFYIGVIFLLNSSIFASDTFLFYKAYSVCDSDIGVYSQLEADNLYKNKIINLSEYIEVEKNKDDIYSFQEYDNECFLSNMDINIYKNIKLKNVNDKNDIWPFNEIFYINDKYLLISKDGFYFLFINKIRNESEEVKIIKQYLYKNPPIKTNNYLEQTMQVDILEEQDNWVYVKARTKKDLQGWIPKSALEFKNLEKE